MSVPKSIFEGNFSTNMLASVCVWYFRQVKDIVGHREINY